MSRDGEIKGTESNEEISGTKENIELDTTPNSL